MEQTFEELVAEIEKIVPTASYETEDNGQVVFYLGIYGFKAQNGGMVYVNLSCRELHHNVFFDENYPVESGVDINLDIDNEAGIESIYYHFERFFLQKEQLGDALAEVFPGVDLEHDNYNQLLFYTGQMLVEDEHGATFLGEMTEEDFEEDEEDEDD